jgi:tocopherol O-methyltransferase
MSGPQTQNERVVRYYSATGRDYRLFWTGKEDQAIHFGYYDASVKNHAASLLKMNEVLAKHAAISGRDVVLDAGCGYGGSAVWLARTIGCQVVGITLLAEQVHRAQRFAQMRDVSDLARFAQMDYTCTSFPDSSFDVIWALESLVHTDRKPAFIHEAARLLRPGGRLLIAEFMLREDPPLSEAEAASLSPWLVGWAMANLLTPGSYCSLLEAEGFARVQVHDLTEYVRPSVDHLGKLPLPTPTAVLALFLGRVLRLLHMVSEERVRNIEAGLCQQKALSRNLWRYIVIRAEKREP